MIETPLFTHQTRQRSDSSPACTVLGLLTLASCFACSAPSREQPIADTAIWRLVDPPEVVIGADDTSRVATFGRVTGALRLANGFIIVSDRQPAELKLFDSTGRYLRTVAHTGAGPGEFRWPGPPQGFAADSFFVVDVEQRRVSVFDEEARPVATRRFALQLHDGRQFFPLGLVSSAQYVATLMAYRHPRSVGERIQTPVDVVTGGFDSSGFNRIARGRGEERVGGEWHEAGHTSVVGYPLEFGSSTQIAVGAGRLYFGETASPRIEVLDLTGHPIRLISWNAPSDPITEADRRARIVQESTRITAIRSPHPEQVSSSLEHLRTVRLPKHAPAFTALLPASDGALWVEQDPRPWTPTRTYLVFDNAGTLLARATIPRELEPYQVASNFILGRWHIPGEADQVRLYRLLK